MSLIVDLNVKFRAFGITFGNVARHYEAPVPFPLPGVTPRTLFTTDDRGVKLIVALR